MESSYIKRFVYYSVPRGFTVSRAPCKTPLWDSMLSKVPCPPLWPAVLCPPPRAPPCIECSVFFCRIPYSPWYSSPSLRFHPLRAYLHLRGVSRSVERLVPRRGAPCSLRRCTPSITVFYLTFSSLWGFVLSRVPCTALLECFICSVECFVPLREYPHSLRRHVPLDGIRCSLGAYFPFHRVPCPALELSIPSAGLEHGWARQQEAPNLSKVC